MAAASARVKKQRAVMASDSDWARIQSRARACGMNVSEYICTRLTAPEEERTVSIEDLLATLERLEWTTRFVYELERNRVLQSEGDDALAALVRLVENDIVQERKLG
ncbi:MAG: hypothetical protein OXF78_04410 [Rhodospirillales bacterium]|nr:hypothetical protein [Rhodospirillales bacterium]